MRRKRRDTATATTMLPKLGHEVKGAGFGRSVKVLVTNSAKESMAGLTSDSLLRSHPETSDKE